MGSKSFWINFLTPCQVEQVGSLLRLTAPFSAKIIRTDCTILVTAKKGFEFNGRSGPQILDAVFPQIQYMRCWCLHDILYDCGGRDTDGVQIVTRLEADDYLEEALEADGMSGAKAHLVTAALYIGGRWAWEDGPSGLSRVTIGG